MQIDDGEREVARMGFLSFSMAFYRAELRRLAETPPTVAAIYRARTLLKMLDDLADEDYTTLNEQLESGGNGAAWLRDYLRKNHAEPFPRMQSFLPGCRAAMDESARAHGFDNTQTAAAYRAIERYKRCPAHSQPIGRSGAARSHKAIPAPPAVFEPPRQPGESQSPAEFSAAHRQHCRQSLAQLTGSAHADDEIRAVIFQALEQGCGMDFETFCAAVLPEIRRVMKKYPQAEQSVAYAICCTQSGKSTS